MTSTVLPIHPGTGPARGLSLIEVMVALALGLFLVGSGAMLLLAQIDAQRRQLLDRRLQQDLRAALDLAARDLRRAGYWAGAADALRPPGSPLPAPPYAELWPAGSGGISAITYAYSRDLREDGAVAATERFGLRINASTRALELRLAGPAAAPGGGDNWQALTDPAVTRITGGTLRWITEPVDLLGRCAITTCPPEAAATCPPRLLRRRVEMRVEAVHARDASRRAAHEVQVSLRNDLLQGQCPSSG